MLVVSLRCCVISYMIVGVFVYLYVCLFVYISMTFCVGFVSLCAYVLCVWLC